jgi:hypothetical protein
MKAKCNLASCRNVLGFFTKMLFVTKNVMNFPASVFKQSDGEFCERA